MNSEDLIEIERAGRRCSVCRSGRGWRRFEVLRPSGREPTVVCRNCRVRVGDDPSIARNANLVPEPEPARVPAAPATPPEQHIKEREVESTPDRLRAALPKLSGSFSTATAARAAGLNKDKARTRLRELEHRGEVHRVGNRWSTQPSTDELASAMERLEARTNNLRIVKDRKRTG
jgi:hypothetical protein